MINIYRIVNDVEAVVCSVSEKNATYKEAIMGVWEVQIGVVTEVELDIQTGDYLKYNGVNYTLNRDDEFTQKSDVEWVYDLIFEHPLYTLLDKLITNPLTGATTFSLTGKLVDFVDIVVWCTNKTVANPLGIDAGWTRGSIVDTDYKNISFSSVSCRDVLTMLSTEFNVEFLLANKQINYVERIENATGLTFIQGKGNGLYEVTKQNVDKADTITRIYPVGGNKNVPNANADEQGYLKLPEIYLENTSEIKRIVEKRVVFEDIFPYFLGSITSVAGTNNAEIICNDIDFNLTEIAVGSEARVNFLTGDLMGCSFEFQWNNALKKLTLIEQKDEAALADAAGNKPTVPSALKKAKAGDKFNFTGVIMPVTYVNNAITKLRQKATDWLSFYSRKRVKFSVPIDNRWMRGKADLKAGDLVTIKIPQKNIEALLRIASLEKNLDTGKITATVSNYLDEKWEKKVEGALSSLQTTVQTGLAGVGNVDILQNNDARPASDNNVMSSLRSKSEFLSSKEPDTAAERITFQKGAVVRDLATPDFVQDKFAGAGAGIFDDANGNSVLEVDKITVRKEAYFNEVIINQIRFQGGIMVYSAANLEVLSVSDGGSYLQLNFDTKNGQVHNQFVIDDQIRCQRFSGGSVIKYYMSRVTSTGTDYIRISKTDIDGTLNPTIGDQVVQFGNRSNTARQSLIEVNVLDGGKQTFYQNVNSYSLTNKNYIEIGRVLVDGAWKNMIRSYGDAYIGSRDLSSYFSFNEATQQLEIAAHVLFKSGTTYKEVGAGIADAKSEAVQLAYNDATTKANTAKDTAISTAATDATNKANAVYLEAKNYADAVGADKQAQIDGQIISWFRQVDALLTNSPASDWTTETLRNQHANDTYTNTSNGKCWRFQYNGSTSQWEWGVIADTATQQALTAAGTATAIANGKRTVFDSQPTTPYLAADLWLNNGDLYKCVTARSSGSFVSGDWTKAVKYTDDTAVNSLKIAGTNRLIRSNVLLLKPNGENRYEIGKYKINIPLIVGNTYTVVVSGSNSGGGSMKLWIDGYQGIEGIQFAGVSDVKYISFVAETANTRTYLSFYHTPEGNNGVGESIVNWACLYDGNVRPPLVWCSSQEDINADILASQTTANNALSSAGTANASVSTLNTYVDGSFKDSVISQSEAQAIEKYKNQVTKDFNDLIAGYNIVYTNAYLIGAAKTDLLNAKVSMSGSKDNLLASINAAIADGKTTASEKADVDSKYSAWDSSFSAYKSKLELANKAIQTNLESLANTSSANAQNAATAVANAAQSTANTAVSNAATAQVTANSAISSANIANGLIADISNDDKVTPSEKQAMKLEWDTIVSEKTKNDSQADTFGISKTAYGSAYSSLYGYIYTNLNDLTTTWVLASGGGSLLRSYFKSYYDARTDLLNTIAAKAKILAEAAQSSVDNLQFSSKNLIPDSKINQTSGGYGFSGKSVNLIAGKQYTLSVNARINGSISGRRYLLEMTRIENGVYDAVDVWVDSVINHTSYQVFIAKYTGVYEMYSYNYPSGSADTVTVNWYAIVEGNKPMIDWLEAPEDDYVKKAIKGSASINGGLVLGNVMAVTDENGNMKAGISGFDDNIAFWGGGTYQQATDSSTNPSAIPVIDRKDGSGHRAKGKLLWTKEGILKMIGGFIGNFAIIGGRIVGKNSAGEERIVLSTGDIPDINALSSGYTNCYFNNYVESEPSKVVMSGYFFGGSEAYPALTESISVEIANFNVPYATVIKFNSFAVNSLSISNSQCTVNSFGTYAKIYKNNVFISNLAIGASLSISEACAIRAEMITTLSVYIPENLSSGYEISAVGNTVISYEEYRAKTEFGSNGFYSRWSDSLVMYFSAIRGFVVRGATDIPAGLGGATVSSGGLVTSIWGKITLASQISKSGNNYTITHNIGDTDYTIIPIADSANIPYRTSKTANTIVIVCAGGFDFILVRTK